MLICHNLSSHLSSFVELFSIYNFWADPFGDLLTSSRSEFPADHHAMRRQHLTTLHQEELIKMNEKVAAVAAMAARP